MKKFFFLFVLVAISLSCSKDSDNRSNNPYLPSYKFSSSTINLSLPLYAPLQNTSQAIVYNEAGVGIRSRVFIINTGSGFAAYDACCPNQELSDCSNLQLLGTVATCPCDDVKYTLFNGSILEGEGQYPLMQYRVEVVGENAIRVYN